MEDEDAATSSNMVRNSNSQNSNGLIRTYWKRRSYHSAMNNLLQTRNRYPNDIFNSLVPDLQNRNLCFMNHIDERSSDVKDNFDGDNDLSPVKAQRFLPKAKKTNRK